MSEVDLLASVLAKTGDIIEGVSPDQLSLPTPCPDYDVSALRNHIVGWVKVFDAGCNRRAVEGDPAAYEVGEDPAGEFRAAAASLVAGWEEHGFDRQVKVMSGEMPAPMVFNMTVMEYLTHGWDLATATSQPVSYTHDEAAAALGRPQATLPDEYRGDNMPFGPRLEIADDAPAIDRFVAFMGRKP